MSDKSQVSQAFMSFANNAPEHQKIWMETAVKLSYASKLDKYRFHMGVGNIVLKLNS